MSNQVSLHKDTAERVTNRALAKTPARRAAKRRDGSVKKHNGSAGDRVPSLQGAWGDCAPADGFRIRQGAARHLTSTGAEFQAAPEYDNEWVAKRIGSFSVAANAQFAGNWQGRAPGAFRFISPAACFDGASLNGHVASHPGWYPTPDGPQPH